MARKAMEGLPNSIARYSAPVSDTALSESTVAVRSEGSGSIYLKGVRDSAFVQVTVSAGDFIPGQWKEVGSSTDVAFTAYERF